MAVIFNEIDKQRIIALAEAFNAETRGAELKLYTSLDKDTTEVYTSIEITGYLPLEVVKEILQKK